MKEKKIKKKTAVVLPHLVSIVLTTGTPCHFNFKLCHIHMSVTCGCCAQNFIRNILLMHNARGMHQNKVKNDILSNE